MCPPFQRGKGNKIKFLAYWIGYNFPTSNYPFSSLNKLLCYSLRLNFFIKIIYDITLSNNALLCIFPLVSTAII